MTGSVIAPPQDGRRFQRRLGQHGRGTAGPMVIALGGLHGNEPAGVYALRRVLGKLDEHGMPLRGNFVALAGNLAALDVGQRFLERDLNRQWLPGQLAALRARDPRRDGVEDGEQRELVAAFDACVARASGPVVFVDLHTSSAPGAPFCCLSDMIPNRRIALQLPIPVILGLEETIDGAILEYFNERGLAGLAIEGGQHDDPRTVDRLEAALWLTLVATGSLPAEACDVERHRATLREITAGLPKAVEITVHHRITPADGFVMRPGFESFARVDKDQPLARDARGEIRAVHDGRLLLPLYQGQGEDGFFLCRDVRRFWLRVAAVLRALHMHVLLPWLPGVSRHPTLPHALRVDTRIARFRARELFHLLGYRRARPDGDGLLFTRRVPDRSAWRLPWRG